MLFKIGLTMMIVGAAIAACFLPFGDPHPQICNKADYIGGGGALAVILGVGVFLLAVLVDIWSLP